MAAAEITENKANIMHIVPIIVKAQVTTAGDWVVLDEFKGVIPLTGMCQSILTSGEETLTYGVARVDNGGVAYGTTDTSLVFDECTITRTGKPFYIITAGAEIIEVMTDATPATAVGTFTVRRGCFGTTATATGLANNNYVGIMNMLFLGTDLVGPHIFLVIPLPDDPRTGGGVGI
jgi:hypothetical protein